MLKTNKKTFLPKIKFIDAPLQPEINWFYGFLFNDKWGWWKYITKKHPKIKPVLALKNKDERLSFIKNYINNFRKTNKKELVGISAKYQKTWLSVEVPLLKALSEIMDTDWPKDRKTIWAMISLNPICPRFLKEWSFNIFYGYKKDYRIVEIAAHECCHFLYFEKWKKLYPKMSETRFESPYLEWHLSEILAPIILNDKRILKITKHEASFYQEHVKIKIGNKTAPQFFSEMYFFSVRNKDTFDTFLKRAYTAIKINKALFK